MALRSAVWRVLNQRSRLICCSHSLVYRPISSSAVEQDTSAEEQSELKDESASADSGRGILTSADGGDEDVRPKPPSSHESPSLLYDPLASYFINMLMRDGKKSQAHRVFMQALELIKRTQIAKSATGGEENVVINPIKIFHQAIENVKPAIATQLMKRGGRTYHIPCSITDKRRTFLACKWIIVSARQKRGMGVAKKLAIDLIDSYNHQGIPIKKKQDLHRLADANRAYSHFRW